MERSKPVTCSRLGKRKPLDHVVRVHSKQPRHALADVTNQFEADGMESAKTTRTRPENSTRDTDQSETMPSSVETGRALNGTLTNGWKDSEEAFAARRVHRRTFKEGRKTEEEKGKKNRRDSVASSGEFCDLHDSLSRLEGVERRDGSSCACRTSSSSTQPLESKQADGAEINVENISSSSKDCSEETDLGEVPPGVEDIDQRYPTNPKYCRTYAKDIYAYLKVLQNKYKVNSDYMSTTQAKGTPANRVTPAMRSVLIDWLVEVAEEYMLLSDTLYLCVTYIDRLLATKRVSRGQLQLVGCVCLLIAAKYEEQYAPQVDEFVLITDKSYNRTEILKMEMIVLKELDFKLTTATAKTFLRRFQRAACTTSIEKNFCNYLAELSLISYEFVGVPPDQVAAAAVYLSRLTIYASDSPNKLKVSSVSFECDNDVWTPELSHYTNFTPENLAQVIRKLQELHSHAWSGTSEQRSVYDKYNLPVFDRLASQIAPYDGDLMPAMGNTTLFLHLN